MLNDSSFFNREPHQEQQEKLEAFQIAAEEYFAAMFDRSFGEEEEAHSDYPQKLETFRSIKKQIDHGDAIRIVDEVRKNLLHIPESMFISPKAMSRLEHTLEQYTMQSYVWYDIPKVDRDKLINQFSTAAYYLRYPVLGRSFYLIARKNGEPVGLTIFSPSLVDYQEADQKFPGLGLGMLKFVIELSKEQGSNSLTAITTKFPRGLGNLGFKYLDGIGGERAPIYNCQLEDDNDEGEK